MGTQQILLIVLSVIIVGAAIGVGIQMFNAQSYSANKSALAADAQLYGTMVIQYYKTPTSLGGAGHNFSRGGKSANPAADIGSFMGWGLDDGVYNNGPDVIENENGKFTVTLADDKTVLITSVGNEVRSGKRAQVVTTITLPEGKITAVLSDVPAGDDVLSSLSVD